MDTGERLTWPQVRERYPDQWVVLVDHDSLARERGSFIDRELADQHVDLLFRARLRVGRRGRVFLLLEHQSTVDEVMPRRVLSYQTRIWDRCHRDRPRARRLPPVLAVLVSHDPGGWTAPRAFQALFDPAALAIPALAAQIPHCSMVVMDLTQQRHADLLACSLPAHQKLALWALRDSHDPAALLASFDTWAQVLLEAGRDRAGLDALRELIRYMIRAGGPAYRSALRAKLRTLGPPSEDATMTLSGLLEEQDLAETRARGRAEGRAEGRVDVLRDQLRYKFKALDAAAEARLRTATRAEIARYSRRLLTADSLAEVFEGGAHRRAPRSRSRGSHQSRRQTGNPKARPAPRSPARSPRRPARPGS
jgi:predicted transposase YdaD